MPTKLKVINGRNGLKKAMMMKVTPRQRLIDFKWWLGTMKRPYRESGHSKKKCLRMALETQRFFDA